jgi:lysozyme family protein
MHENLPLSLKFIAMDEGGFAERPSEPGGAVNKGVSLLVFQEWRQKQGMFAPAVADLKELTDEEAGEIFTKKYASPTHFDEMPAGLDYALLNAAVMEGVRGGMTLLQKALGIPIITGRFDGATWDALRGKDTWDVTSFLLMHHLNKKLHTPGCAKFGSGWGTRILRVANRAKEMMGDRTALADQS